MDEGSKVKLREEWIGFLKSNEEVSCVLNTLKMEISGNLVSKSGEPHHPECNYCSKIFKQKKNLLQHMRRVHKINPVSSGSLICSYSECTSSFRKLTELKSHLKQEHSVMLQESRIQFNSDEDFLVWKQKEERQCNVSYVLRNTSTLKGNRKKKYFSCHRSGFSKTKANTLRSSKAQGSKKINSHCISSMEVTYLDDVVDVLYCQTHTGHTIELSHVPLPKEIRNIVAGQLNDGIPPERIISNIKKTITDDINREHLITRKDIRNISVSYNVAHDTQLHAVDTVSLKIWIETMQSKSTSVIKFCKFQNEEMEGFSSEDFCLVLMNNVQIQMLQKFGKECVYIDSTHRTNSYEFQLTTVMVIDEYQSGFPVAFCISNRVTTFFMQTFFSSLRNATGIINAKWVMTDDTPVYVNAWKKVMGNTQHILCQWHVKRAWLQGMNKINAEKREEIFKYIKLLASMNDVNEFEMLLHDFIQKLKKDEETISFGIYFEANYANRVKLWAMCYQAGCPITTNNHLEAMHEVLEYSYFNGYKNRRLDHCIQSLLALVTDTWFQRFIRSIKGTRNLKVNSAQVRHLRASSIEEENIIQKNNTTWNIKSNDNVYKVTQCHVDCSGCFRICRECKICLDAYVCTCPDAIIHGNVCKHIHAIVKKTKSPKDLKTVDLKENMNEENMNINDIKEMTQNHEILEKKRILLEKIQILQTLIPTASNDCIDQTERCIDSIIYKLKIEKKRSANKKIKKQLNFFSTRNKRKRTNTNTSITPAFKKVALDAEGKDEILHTHTAFAHTY